LPRVCLMCGVEGSGEVEQPRERIRVLIVDDIADTRDNLRKLLSFDAGIEVVGAAGSGQAGIELAHEFRPHIILMDINMPGMDGITATEAILRDLPATQVVMLSVQGETDYLRRAMMAGARDYLTKPATGDELMGTIRRVYETGRERAMMMPAQPTVPTAVPADGGRARREGDVVAVFSPKGGVGCTTIAVNLAVALQQMAGSRQKIALVDASVQFGDVGVMLNLQANRSMADLVLHIEDLDRDMLNSVLTPHGTGLKVLLAPPHPEAAESLLASASLDEGMGGGSVLEAVLGLMRKEFDIIVVDMWSWVDDIALTVFDSAALIVLVVMSSIPAIKSARLFLEVATRLNYPMDKIALVVNGVDRRMAIGVEQIEQAMLPLSAQIPLDRQVVLAAVNHGVPFVMRDPSRPVSQAILQLAQHVGRALTEKQQEEEEEHAAVAAGAGRLRLGRVFGS
jgi:pilus assembly protein CpaE